MTNNIIELRDISKQVFVGDRKVNILCGINFTIQEGELVAVMGHSGSGKTTLLNILGLLDSEFCGLYFLKGKNVKSFSESELNKERGRNIGFIFQMFYLVPTRTGRENIEIGLYYSGKKISSVSVDGLIKNFGLEDLQHKLVTLISGGEQQRTAIVRALVKEPDIVIADEPTGNLDENNARIVIEELKNINSKFKKTLIIVTHNPEVAACAERIILIRDGKISQGGVQ